RCGPRARDRYPDGGNPGSREAPRIEGRRRSGALAAPDDPGADRAHLADHPEPAEHGAAGALRRRARRPRAPSRHYARLPGREAPAPGHPRGASLRGGAQRARGRRAAPAGVPEPVPERRGRNARRGQAPRRAGEPRGRRGRDRGDRHRTGHPRGGRGSPLRPVLHHQALGRGHGPRALGRAQHHCRPWRHDRGAERGRRGRHLPGGAPHGQGPRRSTNWGIIPQSSWVETPQSRAPDTRTGIPALARLLLWAGSVEPRNLLVVDDDLAMREMLVSLFREHGYRVEGAARVDDALARLAEQEFDVVLSDIRMPGKSGIEMVGEAKRLRPGTPVILMTAFGSVDSAVEAMRAGAFDYVTKPFEPEAVLFALERAFQRPALVEG